MIESEGTRIVQDSADDAFKTVIEAEKLRVLEIPVEILDIEVVGYAMRIEAKVGDQVMTFDHVATFKELEERDSAKREISKVYEKAKLFSRAKP